MADLDAVLFDLDGTLVDTAPDMVRALNDLLVAEGRTALPFEILRPHVSHGSTGLLGVAFADVGPGPELERLRTAFLQRYRSDLATDSRTFPGVDALLDRIESAQLRWGVVTNKPGWLTEPLLRSLGLADRASCIVSGDTLSRRKPDPAPLLHACAALAASPARTMYVGDAERDVAAGRAAGMRTLVALFGYIGADQSPARWGATGLVAHPEDIWRHVAPDRESAEAP